MWQVDSIFNATAAAFPGARVFASTFDAFVAELLVALPRLKLPVVTQEIGDTWVYGMHTHASVAAALDRALHCPATSRTTMQHIMSCHSMAYFHVPHGAAFTFSLFVALPSCCSKPSTLNPPPGASHQIHSHHNNSPAQIMPSRSGVCI